MSLVYDSCTCHQVRRVESIISGRKKKTEPCVWWWRRILVRAKILYCIVLVWVFPRRSYYTILYYTILCYAMLCYPTVLVIVQKAREMSTNIPRYCTVGYCTVPCARSSCYTCSFLSSYWKRSLFVFWLALRDRQNTAQIVQIYGDTSHQNIQ